MNALSKEQRKRLYIIAAVSVGVLLGIWMGPVGLMTERLARMKKLIVEQESKVSNARRMVGEKNAIEQNLVDASNHLQGIEDTMAAGDMYAWVILTVNQFRAGHRVEIPQFSREVTGDVGLFPGYPYRAATFSVRGTAGFHDLGKFVADFENAYPYMRLQNFEIEPASPAAAGANAASELLSFKMDIVSLINPNPR